MPFSEARESYLVAYLEQLDRAEVMKTKALLTAPLMTLPGSIKDISADVFGSFKEYAEILLPITKKPDKLKDMTSQDKTKLKDTLKELKKKWNVKLPKK
jgi:hypothetical protein